MPDDDLVADLYEQSSGALGENGIERYEISNFARPGMQSRHNGEYWDDAPFIGYGLSAHSYLGGRRSWNSETFGGYCGAIEAQGGGAACSGERHLSAAERRSEALFTGLRRRDGVDLADFRERYGVDALREYGVALEDSLEAELIEVRAGRLRLTEPRGVLLSNEVFRALV